LGFRVWGSPAQEVYCIEIKSRGVGDTGDGDTWEYLVGGWWGGTFRVKGLGFRV